MKAKAKKRAKKVKPVAVAPFWLLQSSQCFALSEDHVQVVIQLRRHKP